MKFNKIRVYDELTRNCLTVRDFCRRNGWKEPQFYQIMRRGECNTKTLGRLANDLGVSFECLQGKGD